MGKRQSSGPAIYEIRVEGCLDEDGSEWFENLTVTVEPAADGSSITCLTGVVEDQPALRGLLSKIWDVNLVVISVFRQNDEQVRSQCGKDEK
jgi:hypothetical protein